LSRRRRFNSPFLRIYGPFLLALAVGIFTIVGVLFVLSFVMFILELPVMLASSMAVVALAAGCLLSGWVIGRIKRVKGFILGMRMGGILMGILFLVTLLGGSMTFEGFIIRVSVCVISGAVGGVLGVNAKERY
jgi:putative membrane protein (TIGR04086 family)